jgi:isopenicillin-N epimerase
VLVDERLCMFMETAVSSLPSSNSRSGLSEPKASARAGLRLAGEAGGDIRPDLSTGSWRIDPSLCFLNHGSYGSVLGEVMDAQNRIRERLERDPVRFFKVDLEGLIDVSRRRLGEFLGCRAEDIAPVHNATVGLCTIFQNYRWNAGDEIIVTDHEYSSGQYELERIAEAHGIRVVMAHVPFPIAGPEAVIEAIAGVISPKTRMVLVSHVTSCSSLIFPVAEISRLCQERGIDLLIDGAHAPGQVPVDITALNPAFYVGSLHKWIGTPRGASFIYVRPDLQEGFRTVALSSRSKKVRHDRALFLRDFDYMGTDDYSAFLVVPDAIDAGARLVPGGWRGLMAGNHDRILAARDTVCSIAGLHPSCPDAMTGAMVSLIIPEAMATLPPRVTSYDDPLQDILLARHGIQVPIWRLWENPGVRVIRLSAQVYNTQGQYTHCGHALVEEFGRERGTQG